MELIVLYSDICLRRQTVNTLLLVTGYHECCLPQFPGYEMTAIFWKVRFSTQLLPHHLHMPARFQPQAQVQRPLQNEIGALTKLINGVRL